MPQCGFSRASIQILGLQGVDPKKFSAFNVLEDDALRQGIYTPQPLSIISGRRECADSGMGAGIKEYSDWPTIPQLYVNKEFVGGCDILISMHQNGELAKMFEEKDVLVAAEEQSSAQETPAIEATAAPTTAGEETLVESGTPGKS